MPLTEENILKLRKWCRAGLVSLCGGYAQWILLSRLHLYTLPRDRFKTQRPVCGRAWPVSAGSATFEIRILCSWGEHITFVPLQPRLQRKWSLFRMKTFQFLGSLPQAAGIITSFEFVEGIERHQSSLPLTNPGLISGSDGQCASYTLLGFVWVIQLMKKFPLCI